MSAQFRQRMPDELHEKLKQLAEEYGVSLNTLVNMACEEFQKTGRIDEIERRISEIEQQLKRKK